MKKYIVLLSLLTIATFFIGCDSDTGDSSKGMEMTTTMAIEEKSITTNTTVEEVAERNIIDYEQEAKAIIESDNYTEYDLGNLSIELPWIDRRYPLEIVFDDSEYIQKLYCNQGSFDSSVTLDNNSIYITISKSSIKSLINYNEWFDEYSKERDYEVYISETLNNNKIGEVLYYKFRSHINDKILNTTIYYVAYNYIFYDRDKNVIELEIEVPETWKSDCKEMANYIYESIQLPEGHYPENDFLSIEDNYTTFQEYRNQGKYSELYELLQQHLETDDIKENDSAYKAVEILNKIMPYIDSVDIEYDKIEKKGTIKYKSIKDISSEIHIVPIAYTTKHGLTINVGFEKADWLFFDKVTITGKEDNWSRTMKSYEKVKDVIGGSIIRESIFESISAEDLLDISQNSTPIIRFQNQKKDKKIEYQLSQDEIEACEAISAFDTISKELSDLLCDYEKYM